MINAPHNRASLTDAMDRAPAHLRPIIKAVRDDRCGMLFVRQAPQPFQLPRDRNRPAIVIIGDDLDRAVGPDGFHMPSVRRAIRFCDAFAVVSCEPLPDVYTAAAAVAGIMRRNFLLIETRPEQEIAWANLIRKLAPRAHLILAVVEGGRA